MYAVCFCLALTALLRQLSQYKYISSSASEFTDAKKVALTFDDGPHPVYTPKLLDELRTRNIKATFFVTGENAALNPDIIKQMHEDGHLIGNHTYSHIQLTSSNRDKFREELVKTNTLIYELTGDEVQYVRPPYGSWDKKLDTELNMFPVLWNVDPLDWSTHNSSVVASRILKNVSENDIILMHDYYDTSVEAAIMVVDELTRQGYEFVTVDRILFD
jgi:peptidoglycan/xylan/chitin deacetylase (PgdA/CDA1 family)